MPVTKRTPDGSPMDQQQCAAAGGGEILCLHAPLQKDGDCAVNTENPRMDVALVARYVACFLAESLWLTFIGQTACRSPSNESDRSLRRFDGLDTYSHFFRFLFFFSWLICCKPWSMV